MIDKMKVRKEILYCLLAGFISLVAVYFFLGLYSVDMNVPFLYGRDAFGGLTVAQNFITGNGRYLYPNMGAPGVVTIANSPDSSTIHFFGMWILSLFIKEPGLLVNVYYILTYVFVSVSATISLRLLNINPMISILGGVLYSLLPYHFFRGVNHLFLSTYAIVPFACVMILWIINGEISFNKFKISSDKYIKNIFSVFNFKTIISIIIAIFIGMDNSYYIFFCCLGILFAIVWNFLEEKNFRKTFSSLIILLVVIFSTLINLIPYILTVFSGIEAGLMRLRESRDVEIFSLKFSQLVLPVINHRLNLFSRIRRYYDNNISFFTNENVGSSLGLFISAGLILSLFISMMRLAIDKNKAVEVNIQHSAVLNVFMIILGCNGGIASLIAFIVPFIRCYNRLSIFIAFYSLYIIVHYLDNMQVRLKLRFISSLIITVLLGFIFAFDQVADNKIKMEYNDKYYSDKEFIKAIEEIAPTGSMVFQLPYIRSGLSYIANMQVYDQFVPFIHSKTLKWSYRAQLDSTAERWQKIVASNTVDNMLKHLAGVGFAGIYLDKFGYNNDEYQNIRNSIIEITGVEPIISNNERLEYFSLGEYFENLNKGFNVTERKIYKDWEKISNYNYVFQASNSFGDKLLSGWSGIEHWGVWSDGNTAQLGFSLSEKKEVLLKLSFNVFPSPTNFSIEINGVRIGEYTFERAFRDEGIYQIAIPIKIDYLDEENSIFPVVVQFNIENPAMPEGDPRMLGVGLTSFYLSPLE